MTFNQFFHYFFLEHYIPNQYWYIEVLRIVARVLMGVFGLLLPVPFLIWWERRLLGWMQQRQGPNRVGPGGIFQTFADGLKLLFKEDMNPTNVDKVLFILAPIIFLIPAFATPGVIPWGPSRTWGAVAPNVNNGVLYLLAWGSLAVYGIVLAGWSSNNKYSLLGGLRSSAQMISYELGMGLAIISVVLMTGSLGLQDIVDKQGFYEINPTLTHYGIGIPMWNAWKFFPMGFIATAIYVISMLAETNRAPFDLPEAETELVAGYHTEYASMKFASFFLGEYVNMIVVSAIAATLFFGGYQAPLPWLGQLPQGIVNLYDFNASGARDATHWGVPWLTMIINSVLPFVWLLVKILLGLYFFIWIRATLPRLRYDMLMKFGWQGILPVALVNIILLACAIVFHDLYGFLGYVAVAAVWLVIFAIALVFYVKSKPAQKFIGNARRTSSIQLSSTAQAFRGVPENVGYGKQTEPPSAHAGKLYDDEEARLAERRDEPMVTPTGRQ